MNDEKSFELPIMTDGTGMGVKFPTLKSIQ